MDYFDLAQMMLALMNREPELKEYVRVAENGTKPGEIGLAKLLYHMEEYYGKATTVQTAVNVLEEELGLKNGHSILVIATDTQAMYETVASMAATVLRDHYVAHANNHAEATNLMAFFNLKGWRCQLFIEDGEKDCIAAIERCADMPVCVLVSKKLKGAPLTSRYVRLLAAGANITISIHHDKQLSFNQVLSMALKELYYV